MCNRGLRERAKRDINIYAVVRARKGIAWEEMARENRRKWGECSWKEAMKETLSVLWS